MGQALISEGKFHCDVGSPLGAPGQLRVKTPSTNKLIAVAMSATDGLMRGMEVIDTGAPLNVPVSGVTLG
ncbi:hypothetical protein J1N35_042175 [Gossypium stocksii]|uniref:ATPase F1/V1/A1 complex alpha/beta subunit N-terminal domain-containing protein n=1 Tax=Gossypium stocksii TaxID=47602 RepID=A0A9D3UH35_9ROSI|nr:hypothetical protein J1N35_042175 [Gossypium stocksii]